MSINSITTNTRIANQLKKALSCGNISHSYLFVGQAPIRKTFGLEFAKAILCPESIDDSCGTCRICRKVDHGNHEDLLWIQKSGNSVRKEAILSIIETLSFKSFGSRTVVVIDDAHAMTVSAQNKLLKTLEEPPGPAVILLLSERREALLETIFSAARQLVARCFDGEPFYRRVEGLELYLSDRDRCLDFLDATEDQLRDRLMKKIGADALVEGREEETAEGRTDFFGLAGIQQAITEVERARKSLKLSYHIGYTMKNLCLCMGQQRITEETTWRK
jgi:DNA polymerase-3 subunit delta'